MRDERREMEMRDGRWEVRDERWEIRLQSLASFASLNTAPLHTHINILFPYWLTGAYGIFIRRMVSRTVLDAEIESG